MEHDEDRISCTALFLQGNVLRWYDDNIDGINHRKDVVRGTPKFQYSNSATLQLMWHFVIPATLCDHPPKKSHRVATPIDHPVHVAYCLPLPYRTPFYFYALLLPSYFISNLFYILFPIPSIFRILPLSLFRDPLLVAMHSVPYVVPLHLGSP